MSEVAKLYLLLIFTSTFTMSTNVSFSWSCSRETDKEIHENTNLPATITEAHHGGSCHEW